jgi:hypothetical protein
MAAAAINQGKIMNYANLTRDEAIEIVGVDAIEKAESENAYPTGCLRRDGQVEFKSRLVSKDLDGKKCVINAVWLMGADDVKKSEDLSDLDWDNVDHYAVD